MFGFLIGILGGGVELFLLSRLVLSLSQGKPGKIAIILALKLAVLAVVFALVIIFFRDQLLWCGTGLAIVLVAGSFTQSIARNRAEEAEKG
ncbi:MAG: hypothetical protein ACOX8S_08900 [Christensenellales bacterium]|jgi:hypothetical protein